MRRCNTTSDVKTTSIALPTGPKRGTDQRFGWSAWVWSPPPESNRRPHPYRRTTRNRCAEPRSPRSRSTVGAKVSVLFRRSYAFSRPCADHPWGRQESYRQFLGRYRLSPQRGQPDRDRRRRVRHRPARAHQAQAEQLDHTTIPPRHSGTPEKQPHPSTTSGATEGLRQRGIITNQRWANASQAVPFMTAKPPRA